MQKFKCGKGLGGVGGGVGAARDFVHSSIYSKRKKVSCIIEWNIEWSKPLRSWILMQIGKEELVA